MFVTFLVFRILGKMSQNLSSAAVVIGALRVKIFLSVFQSPGGTSLGPALIKKKYNLV